MTHTPSLAPLYQAEAMVSTRNVMYKLAVQILGIQSITTVISNQTEQNLVLMIVLMVN